MIKKLTSIGNSLGVIIERPILDLLGIDRDTELAIKTDGVGLTIRPVDKDHSVRVRESGKRMMDVHDETLKKLGLEVLPRQRIDGAEWLVHQQDGRIGSQRPGYTDALRLAAGKLTGVLRGELGWLKTDQYEKLIHPAGCFILGPAQ